MTNGPELLDFEAFFESEPKGVSTDGWASGAEFTYRRGEDRVDATIFALDGELSFKWWQAEKLRADIRLTGIIDWILECQLGNERLCLKFQHPNVVYFVLQFKSHVHLGWATQWG